MMISVFFVFMVFMALMAVVALKAFMAFMALVAFMGFAFSIVFYGFHLGCWGTRATTLFKHSRTNLMHHACMPCIMYLHLYILRLIACAVHPTPNAAATLACHPSQFSLATMPKRDINAMDNDQEGDSPSQGRGTPCVAIHQKCGKCRVAYTGSHEWWLWKKKEAATGSQEWWSAQDKWLCVNCQTKLLGWFQHATEAALLGTLIVRR